MNTQANIATAGGRASCSAALAREADMAALSFLLSADAETLRAQRLGGNGGFVVHVETHRGFQELDADSVTHAHDLAAHWCATMGAASAAVRRVFPDGTLSRVVGRIHSEIDTWALD